MKSLVLVLFVARRNHSILYVPPFKRGNLNFEDFKKGDLKKIGVAETKRWEGFTEGKGETQLFKLNVGIEKDKI